MLCLSEQGLYFFLGRSDKPKAPFQPSEARFSFPAWCRRRKSRSLVVKAAVVGIW
jgi:hypothetical protein